jgi:hypothetical protein
MEFRNIKSLRTIRKGDPAFVIDNGLTIANRASIQINESCPRDVARLIAMAVENNWIESVAYVKERELVLLGLTHDTR